MFKKFVFHCGKIKRRNRRLKRPIQSSYCTAFFAIFKCLILAGDHVKFGLPMAGATTMLLHGMVFFEDAYKMIGQFDEGLRQIRWPLDYFMKCHVRTDRFYAQV